jgi:hypothetical protein
MMRRSVTQRTLPLAGLVACLSLLAAGDAATAPDGMFARPFSVDLVTTSPADAVTHGALYVGDLRMRVEATEDEVPYVVLYEFAAETVVMRMLDPVSTSVTTFRFDRNDVVELDVLLMGTITLPPGHPLHPCAAHPEQASCHPEGLEPLGEEMAHRWTIELHDGFGYVETFALWAAEDDGRILRTEYPDGYRIDFVNYAYGPQPPELFEVPEEYEAR